MLCEPSTQRPDEMFQALAVEPPGYRRLPGRRVRATSRTEASSYVRFTTGPRYLQAHRDAAFREPPRVGERGREGDGKNRQKAFTGARARTHTHTHTHTQGVRMQRRQRAVGACSMALYPHTLCVCMCV